MKICKLAIVALLSFLSFESLAAQPARVIVEETVVRRNPSVTSSVIGKLKKDAELAASNVATEGFYKIRAADGMVGWVDAEALTVGKAAETSAQTKVEEDPRSQATSPNVTEMPVKPVNKDPRNRVMARVLGGATFFSAPELNSLFGMDGLKNGMSFGLEFGVRVYSDLWMLVRGERIFKDVTGITDTASYLFQTSSLPIMGGLQYVVITDKVFSCDVGLLAGKAFSTKVVSTPGGGTPTTIGADPLTFLGKIGLNVRMSKYVHVGVEAGYRYLKTDGLVPSVIGSKSEVFKTGSSFTSTPITLSGPVAGLNLMLAL